MPFEKQQEAVSTKGKKFRTCAESSMAVQKTLKRQNLPCRKKEAQKCCELDGSKTTRQNLLTESSGIWQKGKDGKRLRTEMTC